MPTARTITELLQMEIPKQPMFVDSAVIPKGATVVVAAAAKTGKSFVLSSLQRSLATGRPLFGLTQLAVSRPVRSLYVDGEIGEFGLQKRVLISYAGMTERETNNIYYVPKQEAIDLKLDGTLMKEEGFFQWQKLIDEVAPEVLIIDPIAAFHSSDENDKTAVELLFHRAEKLKQIHPEREMAVVFVHHCGKPAEGKDPLDPYSMRGSSMFFDRADTVLMLHRKKNLPNLAHLAWELDARFRFRHGEDFNDMRLHVNEHGDGQVKFVEWNSGGNGVAQLRIARKGPSTTDSGRVDTTKGKQLDFGVAA